MGFWVMTVAPMKVLKIGSPVFTLMTFGAGSERIGPIPEEVMVVTKFPVKGAGMSFGSIGTNSPLVVGGFDFFEINVKFIPFGETILIPKLSCNFQKFNKNTE